MDERAHAAYLADLDFFQSQLETTADRGLYFPIAAVSARLGNYDEVIAACSEGLKELPSHLQMQVLMAEAYINVGRKEEAKEMLFEIVLSDADNYKALKLLGMICKSEGDADGALKFFRAAYLKAPEDNEIYGWLEEMGGLPISGVSEQVVADDTVLGDFDADISLSVNPDIIIEEAKAAMSDLMRGKSGNGQPAGNNAPAGELAAAALAGKEPAANGDMLSGSEISDDEILKALGKLDDADETKASPAAEDSSGADTASAPLSYAGSSDINALPAFSPTAPDSALAPFIDVAKDFELEKAREAADLSDALRETADDFHTGIDGDIMTPEMPVQPVPMNASAGEKHNLGVADGVAAVNAQMTGHNADHEDIGTFMKALDKAVAQGPNLQNISDLPELAEVLPGDIIEDEVDADDLERALDSFSSLTSGPPVPTLEEDARLEPLVPKNLVDEIFSESGLDIENPYADDEPIALSGHPAEPEMPSADAHDEAVADEDSVKALPVALEEPVLPQEPVPVEPDEISVDAVSESDGTDNPPEPLDESYEALADVAEAAEGEGKDEK